MNLFILNSSIGRKLVMSITGLFLVLFLTFHMCMNIVALFSAEAYNMICEFLGANWYALVGTAVLAAGFIIHIIYALVLTIQNRKARGNDRYEVTSRPKSVEWASQNMLALGVVILSFLALHLYHFWAKMQLVELQHMAGANVDTSMVTNGAYYIQQTFSNPVNVVLYLIALCALWFHLSHGFWSALQSMGLDNKTWFNRVKNIGIVYATILVGGFAIVVIAFFIKSLCCAA
ncbi:MAG: succinate dehydrogenase/fumarate reductase cytochrome b subunit [Paludibacteraceae bacterium]|nr:succinate dehydrogenase/fumarate reductase cytochrome b subunit [Paludibacteraceae bacterium]